ncbi:MULTISPECIES: hypothetical protein [Caulobacter]|jgi:hypothetical protein|uniref:Type VI protein secretion system component VasK n=1 Tax=Caulobacter rhizosphaerae TaxID=2010972 RepID=A0ABU1N0X4_9CAUL|nr:MULTISPECIES: hypothetical protein [Caulobacter]KQZ18836.1 hypothetical protein ASD47_08570 [Caulobacter sp. Root1472]MDR6532074.1 type VI protein secretion system component VasK [Caulobacter rhizosphaerae]
MKPAFYLCWAIWWIGAAVGYFAHWPMVQTVSNNLFGSLTILLAVVWAGRWIWRKAQPSR